MKVILFFVSVIFISCKGVKLTGYSYVVNRYFSSLKLKPPDIKYMSYKDYLFEFVTQVNYTNNIDGNTNQENISEELGSIYVIPKNSKKYFQIDSFTANATILKVSDSFSLKSGLRMNIDSPSIKMHYNTKIELLRDTVIDNVIHKAKDTIVPFNDKYRFTVTYYYIKNSDLNTPFNINSFFANLADNRYCYVGVSYSSKELDDNSYTLISKITTLNSNDAIVCEAIIDKLNNFKGK